MRLWRYHRISPHDLVLISVRRLRNFLQATLFSTQPQCCLTFSWIELQILLRCCLIHISIIMLIHFLYLIYLCPSSIYVVSMWSIFDFHFLFHYKWSCNLIKIDTRNFFGHFLGCVLLVLNDNMHKSE